MNHVERFTNKVDNYARYRWDYSPEAFDALARVTGLSSSSVVADIGAGCGEVSGHLVERVGRVFAIEPNAAMRECAQGSLGEHPSFAALDGLSDATGLPDRSVDVITVGRAIHWFPPESTRAEFARILKPGGWLAIFRAPAIHSMFAEAINSRRTAEYGWNVEADRHRRDAPPLSFYFGVAVVHSFWIADVARENWDEYFGRLCSLSSSPDPGHPKFAEFEAAIHAIFDSHSVDGKVATPYATELFVGQPHHV